MKNRIDITFAPCDVFLEGTGLQRLEPGLKCNCEMLGSLLPQTQRIQLSGVHGVQHVPQKIKNARDFCMSCLFQKTRKANIEIGKIHSSKKLSAPVVTLRISAPICPKLNQTLAHGVHQSGQHLNYKTYPGLA